MGNTPLIPRFEPYNPGYWSLQNIQKINQWSQGVWLVVYRIYVYTYALLSLNFEEKLTAPAVDIAIKVIDIMSL